MQPGPYPQPPLALPKQPSLRSTSINSVAPTPKTGPPIFLGLAAGTALHDSPKKLCDFAYLRFLRDFSPLSFPSIPPHLRNPPPFGISHNVLASRPDIAGSAHPRCPAHSSCLNRRPEDRHHQCGFGAGRQELDPRGAFAAEQMRTLGGRCQLIALFALLLLEFAWFWLMGLLSTVNWRVTNDPPASPTMSLSTSRSAMRASRPTSSTLRRTLWR